MVSQLPCLSLLVVVGRRRNHRWNRNPRPQPQTFSKLVFLIQFSQSYIFLNWLSGALVGVGGPDFSSVTVHRSEALNKSLSTARRQDLNAGVLLSFQQYTAPHVICNKRNDYMCIWKFGTRCRLLKEIVQVRGA